MANSGKGNGRSSPAGLVLHAAARYDLLVWLFTGGRERAFRDRMLDHARLRPGETVLDVGCGTGTLAILAGRRVGPTGAVYGVDASPEMVARAARKARRADVPVRFEVGAAQALPFPDGQFDVVLTTLMLHHLPRPGRQQLAREIGRVLKPGGRVLAVDFGEGDRRRKGLLGRLHRPHGHTKLADMVGLLREAGLAIDESGAVGMKNLQFVRATAPGDTLPDRGRIEAENPAADRVPDDGPNHEESGPRTKAMRHSSAGLVVLAVAVAALLHVGAAAPFMAGGWKLPPVASFEFLGPAGLLLLILAFKVWYFRARYVRRHAPPGGNPTLSGPREDCRVRFRRMRANPMALSVYKPRGLTRYGARRLRERGRLSEGPACPASKSG